MFHKSLAAALAASIMIATPAVADTTTEVEVASTEITGQFWQANGGFGLIEAQPGKFANPDQLTVPAEKAPVPKTRPESTGN